MSYYTARNPGFFFYIALLTCSVLSFLYMDISPTLIGIMAILWGGFTMMRVLTLFEISERADFLTSHNVSKLHNAQSAALAYDLSKRQSNKENHQSGIKALNALTLRTMIWLFIAATYSILFMFLKHGHMPLTDLVQFSAVFLIMGAAFWAGQSYAHSNGASDIMMVLFLTLFGLCLYKTDILSIRTLPALPEFTSTNIVLGLLATYSSIALLLGFRAGTKNTLSILIGLMLLFLFGLAYIQLDYSLENSALWLSGLSLFSVFWIRSFVKIKKEYLLYQGE